LRRFSDFDVILAADAAAYVCRHSASITGIEHLLMLQRLSDACLCAQPRFMRNVAVQRVVAMLRVMTMRDACHHLRVLRLFDDILRCRAAMLLRSQRCRYARLMMRGAHV